MLAHLALDLPLVIVLYPLLKVDFLIGMPQFGHLSLTSEKKGFLAALPGIMAGIQIQYWHSLLWTKD